MNNNQDLITLGFIAVLVIIVYNLLYVPMNTEGFEAYEVNRPPVAPKKLKIFKDHPGCLDNAHTRQMEEYLEPTIDTNGCPISKQDKINENYRWNMLLGSHRTPKCCNKPEIEGQRKAFDSFIDQRDNILQDSHQSDPVDKINQLYLEGNSSYARGHKGKKIKDMFDNITKGPHLYDRKCVRVPDFDSMTKLGYYDYNGSNAMSLKDGIKDHGDEHPMNGGLLNNGIIGHDKTSSEHMPLERLYGVKPKDLRVIQ